MKDKPADKAYKPHAEHLKGCEHTLTKDKIRYEHRKTSREKSDIWSEGYCGYDYKGGCRLNLRYIRHNCS